MAELTAEHFDKRFNSFGTELKSYADEQTEKLARIVADAFSRQNDFLEQRFKNLEDDLDVRSTVLNFEKRIRKIEEKLLH